MYYIGFGFQDKLICCKMKLEKAKTLMDEYKSELLDFKFCANSEKIGHIDRLSWLYYDGKLDAIEVNMDTFCSLIIKIMDIGRFVQKGIIRE